MQEYLEIWEKKSGEWDAGCVKGRERFKEDSHWIKHCCSLKYGSKSLLGNSPSVWIWVRCLGFQADVYFSVKRCK